MDSTLTLLLVCRICRKTPNEGMFTLRTPNRLVWALDDGRPEQGRAQASHVVEKGRGIGGGTQSLVGVESTEKQALLARDVLAFARVVRDARLVGLVGGDLEDQGLDGYLLAGSIQLSITRRRAWKSLNDDMTSSELVGASKVTRTSPSNMSAL